jgi:hypothetical protein
MGMCPMEGRANVPYLRGICHRFFHLLAHKYCLYFLNPVSALICNQWKVRFVRLWVGHGSLSGRVSPQAIGGRARDRLEYGREGSAGHPSFCSCPPILEACENRVLAGTNICQVQPVQLYSQVSIILGCEDDLLRTTCPTNCAR